MWHVCLSYCSSYALGSMTSSLRSLQIFSLEWGSQSNVGDKKCGRLSEITFLSQFKLMAGWCVFCYQFESVCFFTNGVRRKLFTMFFITTKCVYDFCETVLVKINTPCQGMIWIFPSKMLYFYTGHGFLMVLRKLTSTCEPWNAKNKLSRALPLSSRRGLRSPDPVSQCSKKTTSLPALFCCTFVPGSGLHWQCLLTVK